MRNKKSNNPFQGANFDRFNTMRQQLERQNAALLRERQTIQDRTESYQQFPSQHTIIARDQSSFEEDLQQNQQLPRFEVSQKVKASQERKSVRENIQLRGETLSDDLMEMIQQIQRKALSEIQSLRADKISLLKQLNSEIKAHNHQKKVRSHLQLQQSQKNNAVESKRRKVQGQQSKQRIQTPKVPNTIYQEQQQNIPSPGSNYDNYEGQDEPIEHDHQFQQQSTRHQPQPQSYPHPHPQPRSQNGHVFPYPPRPQSSQSTGNNPLPPPIAPGQVRQISFQNNNNVQPSQSFYYVDNNNNNPSTRSNRPLQQQQRNIHPNNNAAYQHNRLMNQNMQMRSTVSNNEKGRLRNQLRSLQERAQQYQRAIVKGRSKQSTQTYDNSQIQTLMLQGANIANEGQRLMKVKSNPNFRSNTELPNDPRNNYQNQSSNIFSRPNIQSVQYIDQSRQAIQTPLSYSKKVNNNNIYGGSYGDNNGNKFSSGDYQEIINNMKRAAYS